MSRAWKFHNPEGLYFIIFATVGWIDVFTRPAYKEIITDSLSYCIKEKGLVYLQDTALGTDIFALWDPYIASAQDYYPFGMLMPNRVYTDTPLTEQIVIAVKTIERVVTTHEFANSQEGWDTTGTATAFTETERLRVEAAAKDDQLYYNFATDIGEDYRFVVTVTEGSCDSIKIGVQEVPNVLIEEQIVGTGTYELAFTATTVQTRMRIGRYNVNQQDTLNYYIDRVILKRTYDTLVQDTIHVATGNGYRYGFNGKEHDPEWNGVGNMYDYGFRIYDPRIAKFLSVDPLFKSYPWYTPYQFAGNNPVRFVDLDGLEEAEPSFFSEGYWDEMYDGVADALDDLFSLRTLKYTAFPTLMVIDHAEAMANDPVGTTTATLKTAWNFTSFGMAEDFLCNPYEFGGTAVQVGVVVATHEIVAYASPKIPAPLPNSTQAASASTTATTEAALTTTTTTEVATTTAATTTTEVVTDVAGAVSSAINSPNTASTEQAAASGGIGLDASFNKLNELADVRLQCTEIACEYQTRYSGGELYNVEPVRTGGTIKGTQYGESIDWNFHQVYVKDGMVYDPMYSNKSVSFETYQQSYQSLNSTNTNSGGGVIFKKVN